MSDLLNELTHEQREVVWRACLVACYRLTGGRRRAKPLRSAEYLCFLLAQYGSRVSLRSIQDHWELREKSLGPWLNERRMQLNRALAGVALRLDGEGSTFRRARLVESDDPDHVTIDCLRLNRGRQDSTDKTKVATLSDGRPRSVARRLLGLPPATVGYGPEGVWPVSLDHRGAEVIDEIRDELEAAVRDAIENEIRGDLEFWGDLQGEYLSRASAAARSETVNGGDGKRRNALISDPRRTPSEWKVDIQRLQRIAPKGHRS